MFGDDDLDAGLVKTPPVPSRRGMRTDRNNNPIAAAVPAGRTNQFTDALDKSSIPWSYGDPFPNNSRLTTIKIHGDPVEGARAILGNSNALKWYRNTTGKAILPKYNVRNQQDFAKLTSEQQNDIIHGIYSSEGGSGDLTRHVFRGSTDSDLDAGKVETDPDLDAGLIQEAQKPTDTVQGGIKGIPEPKEQVTSTVKEADTGTELPVGQAPEPKSVAPVQFTPTTGASRTTTPTELLTNLLEPPAEGGTPEEKLTKARYKTPPSTELGQAAKIPFSPHLNPTQDDIVQGYLNALGPEYAKYGEKYKQDTGRNILALSPDDVDRDKEGNIYVRPTRAAVDVLNAYVKSGGDINAAKAEGARIAGERRGAVSEAERSAAPDISEVQAARTGMGTYSGARRSVESPLISYGGAKLAQLGGLLSGFGIAPTKASDYLQTRGRIMELGAGSAPLTPAGEEVQRSVPEKVATGLTHLGLGVADIVLLKKGTGLSTGQIMALESLAHDTDLPAAQRAQNATQAYAMGRILDGHLNRAMSGAIFGVPTAVEGAQQVARGQKSKTDALIDTLIQGGTGAILGGGKEADLRTPEVQSREALGIERAAKEGLTPEAREAKVQPYFLRDDQGNPVAKILNPDEVAAGGKMKVRAIHHSDLQPREAGKFDGPPEEVQTPEAPQSTEVQPSEVAATEAPQVEPTEQIRTVPQTPELTPTTAVSPRTTPAEAASTQSPDKSAATATIPSRIADEIPSMPWVRGERVDNTGKSQSFFSTASDIADNFGKVRPAKPEELPKNPLMVVGKEELAPLIGYKGEPRAERLDTPEAKRFDALAQKYAQSKGHDGIYYENGTFDQPELVSFAKPEVPTVAAPLPREAEIRDAIKQQFPESEVWFHGSRAIGKAKPSSDWDIAVAVDESTVPNGDAYYDAGKVAKRLQKELSRPDMVVNIELTRPDSNMTKVAREEGRRIDLLKPTEGVAAPKPEPIPEVEATGIPSSPEPSVREPLARQEPWQMTKEEAYSSGQFLDFSDLSPRAKAKARKDSIGTLTDTDKPASDRELGGYVFDPKGNFVSWHEHVDDALSKGLYEKAVKNGEMSAERAVEIIDKSGREAPKELQKQRLIDIAARPSDSQMTTYQGDTVKVGDTVEYGMFGDRGKLVHISPDGYSRIIERPNGELLDAKNSVRATAEARFPERTSEPSEASARPAQEPTKAIAPELQKFADQAAAVRQTITPEMTSVRRNAIERKASRLEAKARGEQLRHAGADPYELIDDLIIRGGELLDQGRLAFGEWSRKMREEFGKDADPHLKKVWDDLKGAQVEEGQITSIKNAAVESRREALELPNLTPADHQSWEEAGIKAREQGLDTPDKADAIAEQVNNGTKRQLTVEESAGLRDRIRGIENDYQALAKQTDGESDPEKLADLKADGDVLRERYRMLTDASKKAGTDIARALAIRRSAVDQDMLLTQLGAEQSYKLTTGKEPTAEVQKQIKDLVDENARLKTKLDEHEEARKLKAQEKDLNKVIVEKKIEIRRAGRKRAHDDLVKERADIKQQIAAAWKKVGSSNIHGASAIDPEGELSRALGDLARNYIEDGVIKAADIVDAIHEQIKDVADLSKRQVSDLISGYGKVKESIQDPVERKLNEVKSILASTSGKADVLEQGIRPLRRGQQREKPTEDQRRALRELEDAMRQKGPELARQPYDVRTEQASPLDKAKTAARNRQEQLKQWIADGKREVNGRQQTIPDAELKQIKAENAALEKVVALLNDPAADQKAIEVRVDALNRQLIKSRANITAGTVKPQVREGAKSAWSPEIGALMKERDALNRIASDLRAVEARKAREAEKNKPTGIYGVEGSWADFEARAKKALAARARMEKQIGEYQRRVKEQDFSTKPRPATVLDREGNAIRAKLEQVKRNFNRLKEKNNDTTVLDALARWKRFAVLTYGTTIGKLTAAASGRMAATPLYESVGQIGKRVMPKTFAEEPSPRGFVKGEVAAVKQLWNSDSLRDFLSHLKGGEDLINLLYGESGGDEFLKSSGGKTYIPRTVGEIMDRPGHYHAALKTVPKRAAFFRHFERAIDAEAKKSNPRDITDPMVQLEIAGEAKAHQEAQRAILQQKNPITEIFNNIIRRTSQSKYRMARLIGKGLQFEFPITKVPANYAGEVATHIVGLPAGVGEVAGRTVANRVVRPLLKTEAQTRIGEIRRGLEKRLPQAVSDLEPEQRQRIARAIKVGGVGLGFVVWGAMRPDQFGGYYQPGKRDPNDVKWGGMRFMGINIPRWMGHIPPLEAAQFGATIRRVSDSLRAKQQTKSEALAGGAKEAVKGLAEEVPFIDTLMNPMHGVGALVGKEGERQKYVGGELRSMIPGPLQQGAKALDYPQGTSITQRLNPFSAVEPTSRKPESIAQEAEMGIPFLRQTVPISKVFGARPTKASGEVQRLGVSIPGIVKQPDESPREFAMRQSRVNPYIRKTLESVVNSPEYDKASDADKTEWLKQAAAGGRRAGEANEPEKPEKPEKKEFPIPEVPRPLSKSRNPFANRFIKNRVSQNSLSA